MRWFNKTGQTEVWDQKIEWPIGDIEAAHIIREICRSSADSAEQVGKFAARPDSKKKKSEVKQNKRESERYQHAAKAAMEIAMKVSDGLMRDDSVRQIVDLCMKANNTNTAQTLFRAIQAKSIRDEVLREHPTLQSE